MGSLVSSLSVGAHNKAPAWNKVQAMKVKLSEVLLVCVFVVCCKRVTTGLLQGLGNIIGLFTKCC